MGKHAAFYEKKYRWRLKKRAKNFTIFYEMEKRAEQAAASA